MISEQYRRLAEWASTGDKTSPEDAEPAITVADGWGSEYSDAPSDGGLRTRRTVWQWLFNGITRALVDIRNVGILPYDPEVTRLRVESGSTMRSFGANAGR